MSDDVRHELTPAERVLAESLVDEAGLGKPLSDLARHRQRSVESYLRGEMLPRYVRRARDIERRTKDHELRLEAARDELLLAHGPGTAAFDAAWAELVAGWDFTEVNKLIEQHNAYYPIERDLPMDPRTGDYVLVSGRDYRRTPLDADWIRGRFG